MVQLQSALWGSILQPGPCMTSALVTKRAIAFRTTTDMRQKQLCTCIDTLISFFNAASTARGMKSSDRRSGQMQGGVSANAYHVTYRPKQHILSIVPRSVTALFCLSKTSGVFFLQTTVMLVCLSMSTLEVCMFPATIPMCAASHVKSATHGCSAAVSLLPVCDPLSGLAGSQSSKVAFIYKLMMLPSQFLSYNQ